MKIRAIITGSTGMVGKGVLLECLEHPEVESVLVINRRSIDLNHPKLTEIIHTNFFDLSTIEERLKGYHACYFCLGVSAMGMAEQKYTHLTHELTIGFAKTLSRLNDDMVFCYVSGMGTDSSEKGRQMWARVKGKTENDLQKMNFKDVYLFRPGYIQPYKGIKSSTGWYNALYVIFKPLYPILKAISPKAVTTTINVGKAMINVTMHGYGKKHLENIDINSLAQN
jgi:uncharacterized protein YbjT (DUF2867 family)